MRRGRREVEMAQRRDKRLSLRWPRAWVVNWKEERVGDQRSERERRGPTKTLRIEEGEREEGGQEAGRKGEEGGGKWREMVHLEGLSSPPKLEVKEAETEEKDFRKRREEERMDNSST